MIPGNAPGYMFKRVALNTVKQNDISILCIHEKEKGNDLSQIYTI